eukprot:CAMPEP_0179010388 /NCGR_PEP_ID=MMETSP0796-20121207/81_1 /TAXON_ID=73915 /ORGANISM="Pyrodinium bahamense, Strain pbaha01" /LENGTH=47 /DNA_ID= /DNA_START= /DNA_END= /DNA_ORIENTATION=
MEPPRENFAAHAAPLRKPRGARVASNPVKAVLAALWAAARMDGEFAG